MGMTSSNNILLIFKNQNIILYTRKTELILTDTGFSFPETTITRVIR